ncbi:MAG: GIY-YIG nuclease family protein [Chloroflexi bacterium]|nr:GIY-YIG nuclease family protein [Chloroflexota bacterium]
MEQKSKPPAFVYFFDQKAHVKIGISSDPHKRLAQLQVGNPYPINFLGAIPFPDLETARKAEKALHEHFQQAQIGGEWFDFSHPVSKVTGPAQLWLHEVEWMLDFVRAIVYAWLGHYSPKRDDPSSDNSPEVME